MIVADVARDSTRFTSFLTMRRRNLFMYLRIIKIFCVLCIIPSAVQDKTHELLTPSCKLRNISCQITTRETHRLLKSHSDPPENLPKTIQISTNNSELIREKFRRIN